MNGMSQPAFNIIYILHKYIDIIFRKCKIIACELQIVNVTST